MYRLWLYCDYMLYMYTTVVVLTILVLVVMVTISYYHSNDIVNIQYDTSSNSNSGRVGSTQYIS